jgi:hypothetical protein
MDNEILEEVWKNREEFARRYNHDLDAIVAALREMERHPLTKVVSRGKDTPKKKPRPDAS